MLSLTFGFTTSSKKWAKEEKEVYTSLSKKENKIQNSVTITIYVDGKGIVFPVNCLNKDIKKKILKSI